MLGIPMQYWRTMGVALYRLCEQYGVDYATVPWDEYQAAWGEHGDPSEQYNYIKARILEYLKTASPLEVPPTPEETEQLEAEYEEQQAAYLQDLVKEKYGEELPEFIEETVYREVRTARDEIGEMEDRLKEELDALKKEMAAMLQGIQKRLTKAVKEQRPPPTEISPVQIMTEPVEIQIQLKPCPIDIMEIAHDIREDYDDLPPDELTPGIAEQLFSVPQ